MILLKNTSFYSINIIIVRAEYRDPLQSYRDLPQSYRDLHYLLV